MSLFPSPKWVWARRGLHTDSPPNAEDIRTSHHADVQRLAAVFDGPGWYPSARAIVEQNGDGYRVSFWDCDIGVAIVSFLATVPVKQ